MVVTRSASVAGRGRGRAAPIVADVPQLGVIPVMGVNAGPVAPPLGENIIREGQTWVSEAGAGSHQQLVNSMGPMIQQAIAAEVERRVSQELRNRSQAGPGERPPIVPRRLPEAHAAEPQFRQQEGVEEEESYSNSPMNYRDRSRSLDREGEGYSRHEERRERRRDERRRERHEDRRGERNPPDLLEQMRAMMEERFANFEAGRERRQVAGITSPLSQEILNTTFPRRFAFPHIETYKGDSDPEDHV